MTVSIVACGPSAKEWYKTPCDLSIGVNDCVKFGRQVDWLCVVNAPDKFTPKAKNGWTDRLFTITSSKPKKFLCHNTQWKKWFPEAEMLHLQPFRGSVKRFRIVFRIASSKTSPFVAMNIAFHEGAKDIILWGVDFLNHPVMTDKLLERELIEYQRLFEALEGKGVRCWVGNDQTVLTKYLPIYNQKPSSSNPTSMNK